VSRIKKIIVVCTGNSCRSVMAAGLLKHMLKDKGDYEIATAGTVAVKGMRAMPEAIEVMSEEGIDVSDHLSQHLSDQMIEGADLILVMQEGHKAHILSRNPEVKEKVHLLSEFGRMASEDKLVDPNIPDPIGKSVDFYRQVYNIIKEGVVRTVKKLEE
jgi:protein-tyrosine-phosphatase